MFHPLITIGNPYILSNRPDHLNPSECQRPRISSAYLLLSMLLLKKAVPWLTFLLPIYLANKKADAFSVGRWSDVLLLSIGFIAYIQKSAQIFYLRAWLAGYWFFYNNVNKLLCRGFMFYQYPKNGQMHLRNSNPIFWPQKRRKPP